MCVWREMCLGSSNYMLVFPLKDCFCFYFDVFTVRVSVGDLVLPMYL